MVSRLRANFVVHLTRHAVLDCVKTVDALPRPAGFPLGGDAQHPPPPGAGTSINYESYLAEIRHGLAQQRIQPCCTLQAHNTTQAQGCVEKQLIACNLYSQLEITHACNINTKNKIGPIREAASCRPSRATQNQTQYPRGGCVWAGCLAFFDRASCF